MLIKQESVAMNSYLKSFNSTMLESYDSTIALRSRYDLPRDPPFKKVHFKKMRSDTEIFEKSQFIETC